MVKRLFSMFLRLPRLFGASGLHHGGPSFSSCFFDSEFCLKQNHLIPISADLEVSEV